MAPLLAIIIAVLPLVAEGRLITTPARLPTRATAHPVAGIDDNGLYGALPAQLLGKRQSGQSFYACDSSNIFTCPVASGTCFTGLNHVVGCCPSGSSCVPRTTCIPYTATTTQSWDTISAGAIVCTAQNTPYCNTKVNVANGQYILWCDSAPGSVTVSYNNPVTTGSTATETEGEWSKTSSTTSSSSDSTQVVTITAMPGASESSLTTSTSNVVGVVPFPSTDNWASSETWSQDPSDEEGDEGVSHGAIAGIACGSVAGGLFVLLAALWYFKRRTAQRKGSGPSDRGEKSLPSSSEGPAPPDNNYSIGTPDNRSPRPSTFLPNQSNYDDSPVSQLSKCNSIGSPTSIQHGNTQRYTVTNPDPKSPTSPFEVPAPTQLYEVPGDRPPSSRQVSPMVGQTNRTSAVSSQWTGSPRLNSKRSYLPYSYTPSTYAPYAPDSIGRNRPPNLPQQYSAATFPGSPSQPSPYAPYTPSNYGIEAPDSVPRTSNMQPPSLPQEYSAAAMEGTGSPVYRNLGKGGEAPWDFLSAERAMSGGWVNGSGSPRGSGVKSGTGESETNEENGKK